MYAEAPSEIAEIYEEPPTTEGYEQQDDSESTTNESPTIDVTTQVSEFQNLEIPQSLRTVADGFRRAEETRRPVEIVTSSPDSATTLPLLNPPKDKMSMFEEIEALLRPSAEMQGDKNDAVDKPVENVDPAANLAGKEGTVIGHSTVLEIRSSEPKVCFSNGRCITARQSNKR